MLEYYVDSEFKLRRLRGCPAGKHMDCFADWLHAAGYKRRSAQLLLRGAAHLGHWASIRKVRIDQLDPRVLDTFARHIATCTCTHAFHGRGPYNAEGAKRFVERLIQGCDPASPRGSRDRAVILLLARLALRAGDVRDLRLKDIDWSQGRLRVVGKGRCETWLPLPQDAGDAVLHYLEHFRPAIDDGHVFLRVHAPFGPLPSSGPISKLVRRAIRRAGIKAPSMGAHLLRHSAATEMLRQGSSLDVIGAVLRHRSVESTAHYAKVDLTLLRSVAQPWPGHGESSC